MKHTQPFCLVLFFSNKALFEEKKRSKTHRDWESFLTFSETKLLQIPISTCNTCSFYLRSVLNFTKACPSERACIIHGHCWKHEVRVGWEWGVSLPLLSPSSPCGQNFVFSCFGSTHPNFKLVFGGKGEAPFPKQNTQPPRSFGEGPPGQELLIPHRKNRNVLSWHLPQTIPKPPDAPACVQSPAFLFVEESHAPESIVSPHTGTKRHFSLRT